MFASGYSEMCSDGVEAEGAEQDAQPMQLGIGGAHAGEPRRQALDRRPDGDHLDDLAFRLAHDIDAAAGHRADEAFLLQHRHRFADRGAADAEVFGQLALVEADLVGAAVDVHLHDRALDGIAGLAAEAGGDGEAQHLKSRQLRHVCQAASSLLAFPACPGGLAVRGGSEVARAIT